MTTQTVTSFEVCHAEANHYPFTFGLSADWQPPVEFAAENGFKRGHTAILTQVETEKVEIITRQLEKGWAVVSRKYQSVKSWKWTGKAWKPCESK